MSTDELIELRKKIHRNPELSGEEFQTQALVMEALESMDHDELKR